MNGQGSGEERARRGDVPTLRHVHVDHLAMLVDRPVDVPPDPGDLDVGLVDEPAIPSHVPTRPGRVDQQRREPLHPPVEGHVVDLDATLGEQLLQVPVGQPVPQVPAHRQQDHLGRETEPSEPRRHPHRRPRTASALHRATLTATVRCVNATEPEIDRGTDRAGRRKKRFLSPSQKYEIWLQLVRQEVTIAEAAAAEHVDRSTIMRIRTVAKPRGLTHSIHGQGSSPVSQSSRPRAPRTPR